MIEALRETLARWILAEQGWCMVAFCFKGLTDNSWLQTVQWNYAPAERNLMISPELLFGDCFVVFPFGWKKREKESRLQKSHPVILSYQNTLRCWCSCRHHALRAKRSCKKLCAVRVTPGASVQYPWRMQPTKKRDVEQVGPGRLRWAPHEGRLQKRWGEVLTEIIKDVYIKNWYVVDIESHGGYFLRLVGYSPFFFDKFLVEIVRKNAAFLSCQHFFASFSGHWPPWTRRVPRHSELGQALRSSRYLRGWELWTVDALLGPWTTSGTTFQRHPTPFQAEKFWPTLDDTLW